jgi:hypothetical protein
MIVLHAHISAEIRWRRIQRHVEPVVLVRLQTLVPVEPDTLDICVRLRCLLVMARMELIRLFAMLVEIVVDKTLVLVLLLDMVVLLVHHLCVLESCPLIQQTFALEEAHVSHQMFAFARQGSKGHNVRVQWEMILDLLSWDLLH